MKVARDLRGKAAHANHIAMSLNSHVDFHLVKGKTSVLVCLL